MAGRHKSPLVFMFLLLALIPLLPGSVLARNLRLMYFDVFVDTSLHELTGQREMLTGALSEGLVSLPGLDILDRAARDATWKSRKLVVSACEKQACRLESAKALSMELMLEAEIKPLAKRCLVRLTIKDVRKNGIFKTNISHKTACELEGLMSLLKNMAASAWPPEKAQKWKPPPTQHRKSEFGLGGVLQDVPEVAEVDAYTGNGMRSDLPVGIEKAYYLALAADEKGKMDQDSAIAAWNKLARLRSGNPYRQEAAQRGKRWQKYKHDRLAAEKAKRERAAALRKQQAKDTARVKDLVPLTKMPLERKQALFAEYAGLYGWPAAAGLLDDVQPEEQVGSLKKALPKLAEAEALKHLNGFRDNDDDTISDTRSNLTWQQGDSGEELNWEDAKSYCSTLSLGGHTDWRLPDKDTLKGLYDRLDKRASGKDDRRVAPFRWSSGNYWSSSVADSPGYAWEVYFNNGFVSYSYKAYNYYVRCLRF